MFYEIRKRGTVYYEIRKIREHFNRYHNSKIDKAEYATAQVGALAMAGGLIAAVLYFGGAAFVTLANIVF